MQSPDEALAVAARGVHHVGVTPSDRGLPGEIDLATASAICDAVKGKAVSVALSVEVELMLIEQMVATVRPDILHLCGPPGAMDAEAVAKLRRQLPGLPIMQAVAVTGPEAIEAAVTYAAVAEYLILDSVDPAIDGIGAAGTTHDWEISAAIVNAVDIPVVLAGGLSPENVADAIAAVKPWAVDSLTHTNRSTADGGFRKDLEKVAAFAGAARNEVSA
ncbi:MAG: phosphoribosylanthranilate isomerase [bacterium]|nr:phosphoribosylanthranilate isomerase [bacterium]